MINLIQTGHGLLQQIIGHGPQVAGGSVLQTGQRLALVGIGNDGDGLAAGLGVRCRQAVQCFQDLLHVVAVNGDGLPAECLEFGVQRIDIHDILVQPTA